MCCTTPLFPFQLYFSCLGIIPSRPVLLSLEPYSRPQQQRRELSIAAANQNWSQSTAANQRHQPQWIAAAISVHTLGKMSHQTRPQWRAVLPGMNWRYILTFLYINVVSGTYSTVGATRLARATALARSLSNTNMEMFYKHFRLEISTD